MTVVLMAGGRGQRLHPLTERTPKPMIHVGDKPIIQQVLEGFTNQGFKDFVFCLGYKAELIRNHFGDGKKWKANIRYIVEKEPLGTAGALRDIGPVDEPFIVANSDVLTRVNYIDLVSFHVKQRAIVTSCLALHQYQVPYGVAELTSDGSITEILEKPIKGVPVNAGIYVLSPMAREVIPESGMYDMPDLIQDVIGKFAVDGRMSPVASYEISDFWIDVGTWESLERARSEWPMRAE